MNIGSDKRAEQLFLELTGAERSGRSVVLAERCAGDELLRAEVESLLRHHDEAEGFLDGSSLRAAHADDATLLANVRIGSYTVLGVLGSGGMGVVYIAEQERPRRTVALKVIRRGLASPSLLKRFEHEAEVLGRLQHPGIAQIFEAGVSDWGDGPRPFIAMELIKGRPLTEHAVANGLGTRERLGLVVKVCDAVHHAHQRGIIHRDLKPANILVDESGIDSPDTNRRGAPKVLDFGVARATASDVNATTLQTGIGQLIGTLPYMSPEQVSQDPSEVDTRSDVYALGVILYQVLTGRLPFDLANKSVPEAARVIRDEQPARISAIDRVFRGDLETIVSKAIEKDKSRRYQSAAELGADISRYLEGAPILARRDSALYLVRKQINRHRGPVAAAIVFLGGLIGFAIYATIQADQKGRLAVTADAAKDAALAALEDSQQANTRAQTAKVEAVKAKDEALRLLAEAEAANNRADDALSRLRSELIVSDIERGRLYGLVGSLRQAESLIWREWLDDPGSNYARWALWELYSRQPCVSTLLGHDDWVQAVCYDPSGTRLASGDRAGFIRIWDVASGRCTTILNPGMGHTKVVMFSADGLSLASAGDKGHISIWRLPPDGSSPGEPVHLTGHTDFVWSMAYNRDGVLATAGNGGNVNLWNTDATLRADFPTGDKTAVFALAFSPDGGTLATGSSNGLIRLFDLATGECRRTWREHTEAIKALAFSDDGRLLASGSSDRTIRLWDAATLGEKSLKTLRAENGSLSSVSFLADGKTLMSAGWWRVDFWDIQTGRRTRSLAGHSADTLAVSVSPAGHFLATASQDKTLRIWEMDPNRCMVRLPGGGAVSGVAFSPDGKLGASAGDDGLVRLWDAATGASLGQLTGHTGQVHCVRFSPDGTLVSSGKDGTVRFWDIAGRACTRTINAGKADIFMLHFTRDGARMFTCGRDRSIKIWNPQTGELIRELDHNTGPIGSMVITSDGESAFGTPAGKGFQIWNATTGRLGEIVEVPDSAWTLAISPDDSTVAVGTWAGTVDLWDLRSNSRLRTLKVFDQLIGSVAFSPDGSIIAGGSVGGTIKLVDALTGKVLVTLEGHGAIIYCLDFSADGSRLISASDDGSAAIWDLAYYDRHIAGNLEYQLLISPPAGRTEAATDAVRNWGAHVQSRAWPRRGLGKE